MNNLALIIMLIEYNNDKIEWHCVTLDTRIWRKNQQSTTEDMADVI